ncbi:MAG: alcohol dehydrogenase catalytic domain-containing protein [Chloroflexota bacterium]
MRAVQLREFGPPEVLHQVELPDPVPGPDEVVVRVDACSVCYHDLLDRSGKLPGVTLPLVPGHEIAGRVAQTGANVTDLAEGEPVVIYHRISCGHCRSCLAGRPDLCRDGSLVGSDRDGGYAEYVTVPRRVLLRVPDGVPPEKAALAVCPIATSIRAVVGVANVSFGDLVLVTGASGGLGLHQMQLAKLRGANVIAVTSSPDKADTLRRYGADEVVVSPDLKFGAEVWRLSGKRGVNVVLENVVNATFAESIRAMAPAGRMVVLGNLDMRPVEVNPGLLIARRLTISGSGNPLYSEVEQALGLIASGRIEPVVGARFIFPEAAKAHAAVEARKVTGRALLAGW